MVETWISVDGRVASVVIVHTFFLVAVYAISEYYHTLAVFGRNRAHVYNGHMTTATNTSDPYQYLPPLTDDEREALTDSIGTFGVLQPVITDEDMVFAAVGRFMSWTGINPWYTLPADEVEDRKVPNWINEKIKAKETTV